MQRQVYVPRAPLSQHVHWFRHVEGQDFPHARERVLSQGTVALIVNLAQERVRVYGGHAPQRAVRRCQEDMDG